MKLTWLLKNLNTQTTRWSIEMKSKSDEFEAGYHGKKDSMRENAKKMLGNEFKETPMNIPASSKAPSRTPIRTFKKGGKVHKLTKDQTNLHLPQRKKAVTIKEGKPKFGMGGALLGGLLSPLVSKIPGVGQYLSPLVGLGGGLLPFKKGGKAKVSVKKMKPSHSRKCHKADGGAMETTEPPLIQAAKQRWTDAHPNGAPFSKGGKAKSKETKSKGGCMKKYASGGSVYERQMVGENPSRKPHKINYEAEMRGEKVVRARKAEGGEVKKLAMGGAGKVRKGQATPAGKPIMKRRSLKRV